MVREAKGMKILFCIESLHAGGKERQLVELLVYLRKYTSHELFVILTKPEISYPEFEKLGINYIVCKRKYFKKDPLLFFTFYRIANKFNPDIINTWGSMVNFYILPYKIISNKKLVNFQIQNAPLEPPSIFKFDTLISKINFWFSEIIVANSHAGLKAYNIKGRNAFVIHNGIVSTRAITQSDLTGLKEMHSITGNKVVIMVARFSKEKKNKLFVEVANFICSKRNDVKFFLVGGGDVDIMNECKALVKYPKNIVFTGVVNNVEDYIRLSNVGVLLTNGEGISNAIMEYMLMGKPVIAHGYGGTSELVHEGNNGYLLYNDSIDDISRVIISLIDDLSLSKQFGEYGRNLIINDFSIKKMGERFCSIFDSLIE